MQNHVRIEDAIIIETDLIGLLGVSKSTLERLKKTKGFPYISLGRGRTIYTDSAVMKWLNEHVISEGEDE